MNNYKLTSDAKDKIARFVLDGTLPKSHIANILKAESNNQIIDTMCSLYDLTQHKKMFIWYHTIMNVWNASDIDSCFNEYDCIFFKQIIENKGVLRRVDVVKLGIFNTDWKIAETANNLNKMELIYIITLSNYEVLYILNLNYYNEVFKDVKN